MGAVDFFELAIFLDRTADEMEELGVPAEQVRKIRDSATELHHKAVEFSMEARP